MGKGTFINAPGHPPICRGPASGNKVEEEQICPLGAGTFIFGPWPQLPCFSGLWIWTEFHRLVPVSPGYRWHIVGFLGFHNCVNQFLQCLLVGHSLCVPSVPFLWRTLINASPSFFVFLLTWLNRTPLSLDTPSSHVCACVIPSA